MAKSQTFSVGCSKVGSFTYANNFTLYVVLTDRDGNPATNKSYVDYNVYCQSNGSGSINAKHYINFSLAWNQIKDENISVKVDSPYAYIHIASGTLEISHDNIEKIPFYAQITGLSFGVNASISGEFELEDIPRYSEINNAYIKSIGVNTAEVEFSVSRNADIYYSVDNGGWQGPVAYNTIGGSFTITNLGPGGQHSFKIKTIAVDSRLERVSWDFYGTTKDIARIIDATNFNIGETPSMTYTQAPDGCTLRAYLEIITENGGQRVEDISSPKEVSGTSTTFDYDAQQLYSKVTNTNSGWCRYCLITICNGLEYLSMIDRQFFVTNSNPIFSNFTYRDVNDYIVDTLTGDNQTIIKGYSNVEGLIVPANKAQAVNEATMDKYRFSIGEQTKENLYSDTNNVSIQIDKVTSNIFTMYAIDSRGNSTQKQLTASRYINYRPITINSIQVVRTNNVEQETTLKITGNFYYGSFGKVSNSIQKFYYKYKLTTSSEWSEEIPITIEAFTLNGNFEFNDIIQGDLGAEGFDVKESYNIQVFVADYLSNNYNNPASFILGPGTPAIAIYKNHVAIGGEYDLETSFKDYFQVFDNTIFHGLVIAPNLQSFLDNRYEERFGKTILYENQSGTTGTVTLSESVENFQQIKIFYGKSSTTLQSVDVENANGKQATLITGYFENVNMAQIQLPRVIISGNSISKVNEGLINFNENEVHLFSSNEVSIYKVIGYK